MDRVEQGHCLICLVRLELTNQMQGNIGMGLAQGRPLFLCFLDPVLAKHALSRRNQREDRLAGMHLGDCNQCGAAGIAPRKAFGTGNAFMDGNKAAMGVVGGHSRRYSSAVPRRQPMRRIDAIPTLWLMTDERLGDALWPAIAALPRGAGIVFRHYHTDAPGRRSLFARLRKLANRRKLVLIRAGATRFPGEQGVHNGKGSGWRSMAVHSLAEGAVARRRGADLIFISPVFTTRSHLGAAALGPVRAALIARRTGLPAIALGGMQARRFNHLKQLGFHGWAGIDAFIASNQYQKRKAVPI